MCWIIEKLEKDGISIELVTKEEELTQKKYYFIYKCARDKINKIGVVYRLTQSSKNFALRLQARNSLHRTEKSAIKYLQVLNEYLEKYSTELVEEEVK